MSISIIYKEEKNGDYTNRKIEFTNKSGKKFDVDLIFSKEFTPPSPPTTLKSGKKKLVVEKNNIKIFKSIVPAVNEKGALSGAYEFTKVLLVNDTNANNDDDEEESDDNDDDDSDTEELPF